MLILGIVGSPRRDGRTAALVDAALRGAASTGAETRKVYLIDYDIRPFTGQGGAEEGVRFLAADLSALCTEANALLVSGPERVVRIMGREKMTWAVDKDRQIMDAMRLRALDMLEKLREL